MLALSTDSHLKVQICDAGALPISSEPARKPKDSWTSANTYFEFSLEVVAQNINVIIK